MQLCESSGDRFRESKPGLCLAILHVLYFRANLANTIAENQEQDLEKTRQYSQELGVITEQLQKLTLFLQTKLKQEVGFFLFFTNCIVQYSWTSSKTLLCHLQ